MSDEPKTLNGQSVFNVSEKNETRPVNEIVPFVATHLNKIAMSLPDFKFTLIARNTVNAGQDLILSADDVNLVFSVLAAAKAKADYNRLVFPSETIQ